MAETDLVAYLRARLDEEEQDAYEAGARQWTAGSDGEILHIDPAESAGPGITIVATVGRTINPAFVDKGQIGRQNHIVRWSPRRVRIDIAAKRAILDELVRILPLPANPTSPMTPAGVIALAMAQPYAGRDDFNPAWATP